jgi:hypothetical protein
MSNEEGFLVQYEEEITTVRSHSQVKNLLLKGTQVWKFVGLRFLIFYLSIVSYAQWCDTNTDTNLLIVSADLFPNFGSDTMASSLQIGGFWSDTIASFIKFFLLFLFIALKWWILKRYNHFITSYAYNKWIVSLHRFKVADFKAIQYKHGSQPLQHGQRMQNLVTFQYYWKEKWKN